MNAKFTIHYPGAGQSADDVIRDMIDRQTDRRRFFVVSSDRAIRELAKKRGLEAVTSDVFARELKAAIKEGKKRRELEKRTEIADGPRDRSLGRGVQVQAMKRFSIVGAGRLGTASGRPSSGGAGSPRPSSTRTPGRPARAGASSAGAGPRPRPPRRPEPSGTVIIAVPDDAVGRVASALARVGRDVGRTARVPHERTRAFERARRSRPARGRSPPRSIRSSRSRGRTFRRRSSRASRGGSKASAAAVEAAEEIVRALRGHVLLLSAKDKPLYHAACALASNAFVALEWTAAGILQKAGVAEDAAFAALLPLVQGTLQNVKSLGWKRP